ncbi:unnamed protein product [Oikopleura dioica]|uniref:Uncharacterized protein n=1 Tax=Oikopleura dioica TaxID=34765 RepID=Q675W0_OIKDI|nr:hypothetical protein 004-09 [Oikopleura dioica]CBY15128.1 unnamed protein product [Oikopleura dioica]
MEAILEENWIYNDDAVNERALLFPIAIRPLFQRICLESRENQFYMKYKGYFIYMQVDDLLGVVSWPKSLVGDSWMNFRCTIGQYNDRHTNTAIDLLRLDDQFGIASSNDDHPHIVCFLNGQTMICHTKNNEDKPTKLPEGEPSIAFDVFAQNFIATSLINIHQL